MGSRRWTRTEVYEEFGKARKEFERIFGEPAKTAGSAGWQANSFSLEAYDDAHLLYASDARGTHPFIPRIGGMVYKTLQIPTTLPTLDELLGRPEYPEDGIVAHYLALLAPDKLNVLTIHAEVEGMKKIALFGSLLEQVRERRMQVKRLDELAANLVKNHSPLPVNDLISGTVDGRSGTLAVQVV